jgi:hypothetical protein
MQEDRLPQRTLRTTFWVAALFALVFGLRGDIPIAFGLSIGAGIALMSLWTLIFAVPRLFAPGAVAPQMLLGMLTFIKLPLYAVILSFAMTSRFVSPFAVFVGAALVPLVLVLKVVGQQLAQNPNAPTGDATCRSKTTASS